MEKRERIKRRLRANHWKSEPMKVRDFLNLPKGKYEITDEHGIYQYILKKGEYHDGSTSYVLQEKRDSFRMNLIFMHEVKEPITDWKDRETGYFYTTLSVRISSAGFSTSDYFYRAKNWNLYFVKQLTNP